MQAIAAARRHRAGRRRLATPLQDEGGAVGRAQARRVLPQAGVVGQRPTRRGPVTTARHHGEAVAPPLRARQCDVAQPAHGWGGDRRDVWTAEGWVSVSTLWDG